MDFIFYFFNIIIHLDKYLSSVIQNYGTWTYLILFIVVFIETGLVVTPFLPGDSLVFAAGAFAALGIMNIWLLFLLLAVAAIGGDSVNYSIGHFIGPKVFKNENSKILKKEHLEKTTKFYDKYGGKTIIIARFVPIVRTFAPFVAGIGKMHYGKFISYNFFGGLFWVSLFLFGGYLFGNLPIVRDNFSMVIYAIIAISLLPAIIEFIKAKYFCKNDSN